MPNPLSAQLLLAATCCRWPPREDVIVERVGRGVDWARFEAVVARNRIAPLAYRALTTAGVALPAAEARRLRHRATISAARALSMARESLRLQQHFDAAGLPMLIVKGAPLAMLAYDDLGAKEAWDIDILVSCEDAPAAIELLLALDYDSEIMRLSTNQRSGFMRHYKEAGFFHRETGMVVELHWWLVDNRGLLKNIDVHAPTQEVAVLGRPLRTLADIELLTYLCVHGCAHNWSRLKWLADLGALLGRSSPERIELFYATAHRNGAGRAASIALLLCQSLLGIELPGRVLQQARRDRIAVALRSNAEAGLGQDGGTRDHDHHSSGWLRMVIARYLLGPGLAHKWREACFHWNFPVDRVRLDLPRPLEFLYHALRIPLWLARLMGRAVSRLGA